MEPEIQFPFISIVLPCRNEEKYLHNCLESVLNSDYPADNMEVLVFDGMSRDATRLIAEEFSQKDSRVKVYKNPGKTVPFAMNAGIQAASGEYIIRLDAHSHYPTDYFTKLIYWSLKLKADNVGAVWKTDVKNKNRKSLSIRNVLSSSFGVGDARFRTGISKVTEVDTVPFGCYPKDVFTKYGLYHVKLTRNQDIELNKRIRKNGGKIYLVPDITCTYYARETYRELALNNYRNGHWNLLTVYLTGSWTSLSGRHFVPMFFILSLLLPAIGGLFFYPPLIWLSLMTFLAHQLFIIRAAAKLKSDDTGFWYLWWCFMTLHYSYGFGSLTGFFRLNKLFK